MQYDFLRQLTNDVEKAGLFAAVKLLCEQNIEVYQKCEDDSYRYLSEVGKISNGCLYVAAVDLERSRDVLRTAGEEKLLCDEQAACEQPDADGSAPKTLVEIAQEEYDKKRRISKIECFLVIIAAFLYFAWKTWFV